MGSKISEPVFAGCTVVFDPDGPGGNAFSILANMRKNLRRVVKLDSTEIDRITEEAKAGDYEHLLSVVEKYVGIMEI